MILQLLIPDFVCVCMCVAGDQTQGLTYARQVSYY
jgi:hypothetical protein